MYAGVVKFDEVIELFDLAPKFRVTQQISLQKFWRRWLQGSGQLSKNLLLERLTLLFDGHTPYGCKVNPV